MIKLCEWTFKTKSSLFVIRYFNSSLSFIVITNHSRSLLVRVGGDSLKGKFFNTDVVQATKINVLCKTARFYHMKKDWHIKTDIGDMRFMTLLKYNLNQRELAFNFTFFFIHY